MSNDVTKYFKYKNKYLKTRQKGGNIESYTENYIKIILGMYTDNYDLGYHEKYFHCVEQETQSRYFMPIISVAYMLIKLHRNEENLFEKINSKKLSESILCVTKLKFFNLGLFIFFVTKVISYLLKDDNMKILENEYIKDKNIDNDIGHINGDIQTDILNGSTFEYDEEKIINLKSEIAININEYLFVEALFSALEKNVRSILDILIPLSFNDNMLDKNKSFFIKYDDLYLTIFENNFFLNLWPHVMLRSKSENKFINNQIFLFVNEQIINQCIYKIKKTCLDINFGNTLILCDLKKNEKQNQMFKITNVLKINENGEKIYKFKIKIDDKVYLNIEEKKIRFVTDENAASLFEIKNYNNGNMDL